MPLHALLWKFWVLLAGNCGTTEFFWVRTVCLRLTTSSPAEARAAGRPRMYWDSCSHHSFCLTQKPLIKVPIKEQTTRQTNWLRNSLFWVCFACSSSDFSLRPPHPCLTEFFQAAIWPDPCYIRLSRISVEYEWPHLTWFWALPESLSWFFQVARVELCRVVGSGLERKLLFVPRTVYLFTLPISGVVCLTGKSPNTQTLRSKTVNESGPHKFIGLTTWSSDGGDIWEGLRCVSLLGLWHSPCAFAASCLWIKMWTLSCSYHTFTLLSWTLTFWN